MSDQEKGRDGSTLFDRLERCWLPRLFRGRWDRFVERVDATSDEQEEHRGYRMYTAEHRYTIVAVVKQDGHTYLGCQASTRKPRAGEDHTRGNDLPDGGFNHDTWLKIVHAIVAYELVKLEPVSEPVEVENGGAGGDPG